MGQFGIGIHSYARDLSLSKPFWGILAIPVYRRSIFVQCSCFFIPYVKFTLLTEVNGVFVKTIGLWAESKRSAKIG